MSASDAASSTEPLDDVRAHSLSAPGALIRAPSPGPSHRAGKGNSDGGDDATVRGRLLAPVARRGAPRDDGDADGDDDDDAGRFLREDENEHPPDDDSTPSSARPSRTPRARSRRRARAERAQRDRVRDAPHALGRGDAPGEGVLRVSPHRDVHLLEQGASSRRNPRDPSVPSSEIRTDGGQRSSSRPSRPPD